MEKNKAKQKILKTWEQIRDIFRKNFNVDNDRIILKLDKEKLPHLSIEEKKKRKKSPDFILSINGKHFSSKQMNADDILLEVIRIAKVEEVEKLDLRTVKDYKLVTSQKGTPNRKELEGKYVYIKSGTPHKLNLIRIINDALDLGVDIKYI
jgi:hypothetical protein